MADGTFTGQVFSNAICTHIHTHTHTHTHTEGGEREERRRGWGRRRGGEKRGRERGRGRGRGGECSFKLGFMKSQVIENKEIKDRLFVAQRPLCSYRTDHLA
jgi:hypothetical protein